MCGNVITMAVLAMVLIISSEKGESKCSSDRIDHIKILPTAHIRVLKILSRERINVNSQMIRKNHLQSNKTNECVVFF